MGVKDQPLSQRVYANGLRWFSIVGFIIVAAGFIAYLFLPIGSTISVQAVVESWHLSAGELNARLGLPTGWGWMSILPNGDALSHASILFLTLGTPICLIGVLVAFARERNTVYFILVIIQIIILVFAITGIGVGSHA
jgi:hypothetical protein